MKYDPIEQARLIYEAQPTAYNASAYQVAMQLAALKAELEQDRKQLQAELKAAKAHLAYAERMAEQYKWQPIDTAPMDRTDILAVKDKEIKIVFWYPYLKEWGSQQDWADDGKWEPTHWMKLPEAPEAPEEPVGDVQ